MAFVLSVPIPIPITMPRFKNGRFLGQLEKQILVRG